MGLQKFWKNILKAPHNLEFLAVSVFPDSSITLDIRVSVPTILVLLLITDYYQGHTLFHMRFSIMMNPSISYKNVSLIYILANIYFTNLFRFWWVIMILCLGAKMLISFNICQLSESQSQFSTKRGTLSSHDSYAWETFKLVKKGNFNIIEQRAGLQLTLSFVAWIQ